MHLRQFLFQKCVWSALIWTGLQQQRHSCLLQQVPTQKEAQLQ